MCVVFCRRDGDAGLTHGVRAFQRVGVENAKVFVESNATTAFLREAFASVLHVHVFYCEITVVIFKMRGIQRDQFGVQDVERVLLVVG